MTKYLMKTTYRRKFLFFFSKFRRFQSIVGWLHCFWALVRQSIMVKAAHLIAARKQRKGLGTKAQPQ
jgi:hypothetical protein